MHTHGYNDKIWPNAGNFQEYNYELEWMENSYNIMCGCMDLVSAWWYPWIDRSQYQFKGWN